MKKFILITLILILAIVINWFWIHSIYLGNFTGCYDSRFSTCLSSEDNSLIIISLICGILMMDMMIITAFLRKNRDEIGWIQIFLFIIALSFIIITSVVYTGKHLSHYADIVCSSAIGRCKDTRLSWAEFIVFAKFFFTFSSILVINLVIISLLLSRIKKKASI